MILSIQVPYLSLQIDNQMCVILKMIASHSSLRSKFTSALIAPQAPTEISNRLLLDHEIIDHAIFSSYFSFDYL